MIRRKLSGTRRNHLANRVPGGRLSQAGGSDHDGPTPEVAARGGGQGEQLVWLAKCLSDVVVYFENRRLIITGPHISAANAWRRDRNVSRNMMGVRAPGAQREDKVSGTAPSLERQQELRTIYRLILDRLKNAGLVDAALEMVVMDNLVPEMMLHRPSAIAALISGLDVLEEVYR